MLRAGRRGRGRRRTPGGVRAAPLDSRLAERAAGAAARDRVAAAARRTRSARSRTPRGAGLHRLLAGRSGAARVGRPVADRRARLGGDGDGSRPVLHRHQRGDRSVLRCPSAVGGRQRQRRAGAAPGGGASRSGPVGRRGFSGRTRDRPVGGRSDRVRLDRPAFRGDPRRVERRAVFGGGRLGDGLSRPGGAGRYPASHAVCGGTVRRAAVGASDGVRLGHEILNRHREVET